MLREMHYVYEVYKEMSFSKAARNLYISQPALSTVIKKLENELQHPLFDRSTNPIRLTPAGQYYIQNIEQILVIEKNLKAYFDDLSHLRTGSIHIGGTTFFCSYVIPPLIHRFSSLYPGISIQITETSTNHLFQMLQNSQVDLILDSSPLDRTLFEGTELYPEELILAVPAEWKVNNEVKEYQYTFRQIQQGRHRRQTRFVPLETFANCRFLLLKEGNDLHTRSVSICRQAGFIPENPIYLDQMMTLYHFAISQMGATFIRDTLTQYEAPTDQLIFYRIGNPLSQRTVQICTKKKKYLTNAMAAFIRFSRETCQA